MVLSLGIRMAEQKTSNRGKSRSIGKSTGILESMTGVDFIPALNEAQDAIDAQNAPYLGHEKVTVSKKLEFDLSQIEYLARQHCSFGEIAKLYRCAETTVANRYKDDEEFRAAYDAGRFHTIEVIRRKQIEAASDGNTQMLIWLGKQYLGQSDKQDVSRESRSTPINIQINAPAEIKEIDDAFIESDETSV